MSALNDRVATVNHSSHAGTYTCYNEFSDGLSM